LYRRSGLTRARFVREHGIKLSTFQQWLSRPTKPNSSEPPRFQEMFLSPPPAPSTWAAELSFATGMTVRLAHWATPKFIAQLLQRLRPLC
jgi:hypothetical protein